MQRAIPTIRVASYPASKSFYESLGFREQWTHQFEPGFPIFACLERGEMEIFLTEHVEDCHFGALVHFRVGDVDALHTEYKQIGVPIAEPPNNGLGPDIRVMSLVDPDDNRLRFFTVTLDRSSS